MPQRPRPSFCVSSRLSSAVAWACATCGHAASSNTPSHPLHLIGLLPLQLLDKTIPNAWGREAPREASAAPCFQRISMQRLSVRWGRLIRTGVAQDPKAPLLVGHVDITAGIDEHVFSLGNEVSGQRPCALAWRRRN